MPDVQAPGCLASGLLDLTAQGALAVIGVNSGWQTITFRRW